MDIMWHSRMFASNVIYSFSIFSHHRYPIVFHWSLSDRKPPHVSGTLLSIQANINYYNYYVLLFEFFTTAVFGGFSLVFE